MHYLLHNKIFLHRGFVDENGDGLDLAAVGIDPVQVVYLDVRQALAMLALLELGNVLLELIQIAGDIHTLQFDVVLSGLLSHLEQNQDSKQRLIY